MSNGPRTRTITLRIAPPHRYQEEWIGVPQHEPWDGMYRRHALAGRGGGKTRALVLDVLEYVTMQNPGYPVYVSEPTAGDAFRIFLRTWRDVVPEDLWSMRTMQGVIEITMHHAGRYRPDGSFVPSIIDVISRYSDNSRKDPGRGIEYAAGWDDELAMDESLHKRRILSASIRLGRKKLHKSASTPKCGWYQSMIEKARRGAVVRWTSYDNPYLDRQWIEDLKEDYSPELAAQEINAEFVAQSGRIWRNFAEQPGYWPATNRHWMRYDNSRSYTLTMDIGSASAAFVAVQTTDPIDRAGVAHGNRPLIVAVAEWMPGGKTGAGIDQMLQRVMVDMGRPPDHVVAGADVTTRANTDLRTAQDFIAQHYGTGVPVTAVTGKMASKPMQHALLDRLILNSRGERRFCVSEHMTTWPSERESEISRGVRAVMYQDSWPDETRVVHSKDYLPKEGRYEHCRDALLYMATAIAPPMGGYVMDHAA